MEFHPVSVFLPQVSLVVGLKVRCEADVSPSCCLLGVNVRATPNLKHFALFLFCLDAVACVMLTRP